MALEDNKNLDEMTRLTLRVIRLEELEEAVKKLENDCYKGFATITELDKRVRELESARALQRTLNQTFQPKAPKAEEKPKK